MPRGLKKEVASIFRVKQSYAVNLSGVRLIGLEIMVSNEEFFHVTRIIRILEERYKLSLFEFSEKESADSNGISIKVGSKPILQVA
ncbi:hypothetical protein L861_14245 [Litchfieldella anticariensis FP35 = DSM 16096]|uniref:Uncharacterized protein n=2 Tax=Litchfieldella anticariensis TaxID=258591 RepID=S2KEY3_LITA3|nr:hypothetical protein L861_14245 [Halomonas anticariensis FP35 = DSM 16096]